MAAVHPAAFRVTLPPPPTAAPCNICGDARFEPGPAGRLGPGGAMPRCSHCRSLERHRQIRQVYDRMRPHDLARLEVLQLSPDVGVEPGWFLRFELSEHGGPNSLDLQAIARPTACYDLVICNHVLEHVADDRQGFRELLRIIRPEGFLQLTVPSPHSLECTVEWGYPRAASNYHYRGYGRDLVGRFLDASPGTRMIEVAACDPVTGALGYVYLATRSERRHGQLLQCLAR